MIDNNVVDNNVVYNYFYKITNNINNKFYYGVHCTNNLNDGYMGSGVLINKAYKKYGKENFTKEIIKYFNTWEDAYEYEAQIVTEELVKDHQCYNLKPGGAGWNMKDRVYVYNENNDVILISNKDPKYLDGTYQSVGKNSKIAVIDKHGNQLSVYKDDPRLLSGELTYKLKLYITVKDKNGNTMSVSKDDPRYISGELIPIWKDKHHSDCTKSKISKANKNKFIGDNNPQYGKCWITKNDENKFIDITLIDQYLNNGWIKGRHYKTTENINNANRNRCWVYKNGISKHIQKDELDSYINNGWINGRSEKKTKKNNKVIKKISTVIVDINGLLVSIDKNDPRYISGELKSFNKGKVAVQDKDGNKLFVSINDSRYVSGELIRQSNNRLKNKVTVKDKDGNTMSVSKDDPRYLSGELQFISKGVKYNKDICKKMSEIKTKEKMTWVNNGITHKYVSLNNLDSFLSNNPDFVKGRIKKNC